MVFILFPLNWERDAERDRAIQSVRIVGKSSITLPHGSPSDRFLSLGAGRAGGIEQRDLQLEEAALSDDLDRRSHLVGGEKDDEVVLERLLAVDAFPGKINVTERRIGFLESEVDAFIAERVAERDAVAVT